MTPNVEHTVATPELIAELRDYAIECYQRRLPQAAPEPGTSLYAIIEASAMVWATYVANAEHPERTLAAMRALVAADRAGPIGVPEHDQPDFYAALADAEGKPVKKSKLPAPGSAPGTGCFL